MKTVTPFRLILLSALLGLATTASAQTLLLEYKFNDSGTTAANSGSLTSLNANLVASDYVTATDLHGASGSGVSGQAGDKALDLTIGATGQGSGKTGPAALTGTGGLGTLKSFTLMGWYKVGSTGNNARLFDNGGVNNGSGITLWMPNTNTLNLTVDGLQTGAVTSSTLALLNTWVFFALTYDGTTTTNNINLYVGTQSGAITSIAATASSTAGDVAATTVPIVLGNGISGNQRPLNGLMDDLRLYGSATDTTGVLSLSAIESMRALDAVPEPRLTSLLLMAFALGLIIRLSRHSLTTHHK